MSERSNSGAIAVGGKARGASDQNPGTTLQIFRQD